MERPKIRLGICMAGAVSAGAFTAGAMDYLIETLERWEQLKSARREKIKKGEELTENEKLIPDYDVTIEILSGASAGGMTAAVLGYSLLDNSYLNTKNDALIPENYNTPDTQTKKSKLYNCWVNMADDEKLTTLDKLLDTSDVKSITEMNALLNSKAINEIANNALPEKFPEKISYPSYISPDLSIFLTVTNLEGLPVEIKFGNTSDTKNQFRIHSGFLHYSFLKKTGVELDYPSEILTRDNYKNLIVAAKSTGAFPIGLENQKVKILKEFMQKYKENLFKNYKLEVVYDKEKDGDYKFTAVDGGLINNEPIGTTARFLKNYTDKGDSKHSNYLILIDPFPNITNAEEAKAPKKTPDHYNLVQIISKLFGAVRNQSMFKQEDLLEGLNMENNKYLIYPSKDGRYFLACGLIAGFSGFLKRGFREHDYQLGRKNCQSFLRYYFGEELAKFDDLGIQLNDGQKELWGYYPNQDKKLKIKMPLIPDMLYLDELAKNKNYAAKSRGSEVENPEYKGLEESELKNILSKIEKRVSKIVDESFGLVKDLGSGFWAKAALWLFKSKIKNFGKDKTMQVISDYLNSLFKPKA